MTSTNINKIVQSNINFKPWMLSRNTNEIVNAYVQKIYKRMPTSYNKDVKTVKVANPRPENRGPLSTLKNLEKQMPLASITPRTVAMKKSNSRLKQQNNHLMNFLKMRNKNNEQMASRFPNSNLANSKRLSKTPNYKIYRTLRYGSSSSSSRSSLFKRYDERRRQSNPAQINYLIRSFHTGKFEPTYARFLMPARNQQLESNLGSIPDAIKFSGDMLKDLMKIDKPTKHKADIAVEKKIHVKHLSLDQSNLSNQLPKLRKSKIKISKDSALKDLSSNVERSVYKTKLSPEHREQARLNVAYSTAQLRHAKPTNDLFAAEHDRNHTELHEKHRRNRMKKLGLIEDPGTSEKELQDVGEISSSDIKLSDKQSENELSLTMLRTESALKQAAKSVTKLKNQANTVEKMKPNSFIPTLNFAKPSLIPLKANTNLKRAARKHNSSLKSSAGLPKAYNTISPIVAARAQMSHVNDLRSYRYNRSDFFSTKKY